MSEAKITRQRVKEFIAVLEKAGTYPRARLIRSMNGDQGSLETISKYLYELHYPPKGQRSDAQEDSDSGESEREAGCEKALIDVIQEIATKGVNEKITGLETKIEAIKTAIENNSREQSVPLGDGSAWGTATRSPELSRLKERIAQATNMLVSVVEEFDGVVRSVRS